MRKSQSHGFILAIIVMYFINFTTANATYDIVKRAKLVDDKINTLEITRPIKHDFFINIKAFYAPEIIDIIDDSKKIEKLDTSDTSAAITEVNTLLEKYYDKEQILKADVGLGFPLPSFSPFKVRIKPNFRVEAGLFAMITPQKVQLNFTDIITNLEYIPAEIRTKLTQCLTTPPADGTDLLVYCLNNGLTQIEVDKIKTAGFKTLPYSSLLDSQTVDTPSINIYAKAQAKAGFFTEYRKGKHFFGHFNLYALGRTDILKYADAIVLLGGGGGFDYSNNTTINLVTDFSFGYKNSNYSTFIGLEEVKLSQISKEDEATLSWGEDMLVRLHAQADYSFFIFKLRPYLGTHMRSGYSVADAYYLGADWGLSVFKDRLGVNFKTQVDKEHFTLGARLKVWVIQAELTGKLPVTSTVDGIKVSTYYGANIRFFF